MSTLPVLLCYKAQSQTFTSSLAASLAYSQKVWAMVDKRCAPFHCSVWILVQDDKVRVLLLAREGVLRTKYYADGIRFTTHES